jgi:alkanesulfonate monooxygenase SsuD/methylene tetrahydromethanopterin reductase-like flavin-dependent oxidoreductase (luciferase family)
MGSGVWTPLRAAHGNAIAELQTHEIGPTRSARFGRRIKLAIDAHVICESKQEDAEAIAEQVAENGKKTTRSRAFISVLVPVW